MDSNFYLLNRDEAFDMLAKVANIDRATAMLAMGGNVGNIPAPEKYCTNPPFYKSTDLVSWADKYAKKLKQKPEPKLKMEQA